MVVATPADVGVPDRGCVRRVRFGEGAIEPVLQDRLDRAVGGGADIVAAPGRVIAASVGSRIGAPATVLMPAIATALLMELAKPQV